MSTKLTRLENALCFVGACAMTALMLLVADFICGESINNMTQAVALRQAISQPAIQQKPVDDLLAELNLCKNQTYTEPK